jgi:hypothetical protein
MQNIALSVDNNSSEILPVPLRKKPVPPVDSPVDFGSSPYPMPLKPSSRKNDDLQYCNFLQPSPRDQRLNTPYEGNKYCPSSKAQPYKKDSCYFVKSNQQGVSGIVCNEPGGSDNANFYRGNQFGVDYPFDFNERMERKKIEYTVERPVQDSLAMQNPMVMYDNSTFYPENNFALRQNKDYLTYPLPQNYTKNGIPTYIFPYKVLNPPYNNRGNTVEKFETDELHEDFENNYSKIFFVVILLIIILLLFTYLYK